VYAIAALTLGLSKSGLEPYQKTPIVWFLVLFPPAVLAVFSWLVSQHHSKLYAPSDFRDDKAFLQAQSPAEQRERLEQEAKATFAEEPADSAQSDGHTIGVPTIQSRNIQLRAVAIAEDLAIRELSLEFGAPIRRQLKVSRGDRLFFLDGGFTIDGTLIGVEIKLLRRKSLHNRIREAEQYLGRTTLAGLKMVLALVVDDVPERVIGDAVETLRKQIRTGAIAADIRIYRFNELCEKYGLSPDNQETASDRRTTEGGQGVKRDGG
jgi:hypothetical protein